MDSSTSELDRLLQELQAPSAITDETLVVSVLNVLGDVAADLVNLIEDAETTTQAFDRLAAIDVASVFYRCATAFTTVRLLLDLRASARRAP
jgi:hypothetical protein